MMIPFNNLQMSDLGFEIEGTRFGIGAITFIVGEIKPGLGVKLHNHPYQEIIVILEGKGVYQLDDVEMELHGGNVLFIPAKAKHKFRNSGNEILKQIDIHLNEKFITHWLE